MQRRKHRRQTAGSEEAQSAFATLAPYQKYPPAGLPTGGYRDGVISSAPGGANNTFLESGGRGFNLCAVLPNNYPVNSYFSSVVST